MVCESENPKMCGKVDLRRQAQWINSEASLLPQHLSPSVDGTTISCVLWFLQRLSVLIRVHTHTGTRKVTSWTSFPRQRKMDVTKSVKTQTKIDVDESPTGRTTATEDYSNLTETDLASVNRAVTDAVKAVEGRNPVWAPRGWPHITNATRPRQLTNSHLVCRSWKPHQKHHLDHTQWIHRRKRPWTNWRVHFGKSVD